MAWGSAIFKTILPRTLFGRALLIIVTPLILLQIVTTLVFYDRHWETVARRLSGGVAGEVATLIRLLDERTDPGGRTTVLEMARQHMELRAALKLGAILPNTAPATGSGILERTLSRALTDRVRKPFHIDTKSYDREIEINVQLPEGVLQVFTSRKRLFTSTTYIFVIWMVGTSLILFAVAMLFMRNQVRPIRRLAAAAESFGKGRDVPEFHPSGATEVRQAAAAFLDMRDRIRRQMGQRTDMLSGVSHDLRTPLTRMKLQLAMLADSPETAELKSDIAEMETMIEGYLAFARGEGTERPREVDLAALLGEVAEGARRDGAEVALATNGALSMTARPDAVKRSLTNIVANAARYGERVAIAAKRQADAIEITIDDDGPGIPGTMREDVFRPFFRLDRSRNPATGGIGLGLTIARDVIRGHGGDLTLASSPLGGLRATVRLPV